MRLLAGPRTKGRADLHTMVPVDPASRVLAVLDLMGRVARCIQDQADLVTMDPVALPTMVPVGRRIQDLAVPATPVLAVRVTRVPVAPGESAHAFASRLDR